MKENKNDLPVAVEIYFVNVTDAEHHLGAAMVHPARESPVARVVSVSMLISLNKPLASRTLTTHRQSVVVPVRHQHTMENIINKSN